MRAAAWAAPCVGVASARRESISNSAATGSARGYPGTSSRGRRDIAPARRAAPRDTGSAGVKSLDRYFDDRNGVAQSPRLAEYEEESPYYGPDDDDEDDGTEDENPVLFPVTATVALGAWFGYTRKQKMDEEARVAKAKGEVKQTKPKSPLPGPMNAFFAEVKAEITSITVHRNDGKTPKQRYRDKRAARRVEAEKSETKTEKARSVRREELRCAAEIESRGVAAERVERAKDALVRDATRERLVREARVREMRRETEAGTRAFETRVAEAKRASETREKEKREAVTKLAETKAKAAAKETAAAAKEAAAAAKAADANAKEAAKAESMKKAAQAQAKAASAEGKALEQRAANKAAEAAKQAEATKAKADAAGRVKVAEAKAKAADSAAKTKVDAKARLRAKLAVEKAKMIDAKASAQAKASALSFSGQSAARGFGGSVSTTTKAASAKLTSFRVNNQSLPTPRGVVRTAQSKVKELAVAVDTSPNPYVATAARVVGVKPSFLIASGFVFAAAAIGGYVRRRTTNDDYKSFDAQAGNVDRDEGGFGREQQRAFLEKQLKEDRDSQRARWQSAMDDGSNANANENSASTSGSSSFSAPPSETMNTGAVMRDLFGLGDAATKADGETGDSSDAGGASDEYKRLQRIREMNRVSGDATAVAESKLRLAREARAATIAEASSVSGGTEMKQSASGRRRAEQKRRAEQAVLSEYQSGPEDGAGAEDSSGWDPKEVREMSRKYKQFLKQAKAKKWWGGE